MIVLGSIVVILFSFFYGLLNYRYLVQKEIQTISESSRLATIGIDTYIDEIINTAATLSLAPIIREALLESNEYFGEIPDKERINEIERLNNNWMDISDIDDPFIQSYMNNPVSEYLRLHESIIPDKYREIFLTNHYGVIISTTKKITTLAHSNKYWWEEAYNNGEGEVFLDDNGYDESVQGYVLGVVIPIKYDNEIIGILKCNLNISSLLENSIESYKAANSSSTVKIVRTSGLIVAGDNAALPTEYVNESIIEYLNKKENIGVVVKENGNNVIIGISPVEITMGSEEIGFGGNYGSIDHTDGNNSDPWHIIISIAEKEALSDQGILLLILIGMGIIFIIGETIVAYLFTRNLSKSIKTLASFANRIGKGNFGKRININSNDEIGFLAKSLNNMSEHLQNTMASKDILIAEIKARKKAEKNLKYLSFHDKLTRTYNRAYFEEELSRIDIGRQLPISIILGDVNGLKLVNDVFGHDQGDKLLINTAAILKKCCRKEDVLARYGGDEFAIILPKTSAKLCAKVLKRIKNAMSGTINQKIPLSVSLGTATKGKKSRDINKVLRKAEDNMYARKLIEGKSISSSIISSLTESLWQKDIETRKHTDRLEDLALKMGKRLKLPENQLANLSLLATLHDIGELAIPARILKNKNKLTKKQWEIVKRHPEVGSRIAQASPMLLPIADLILSHHEWWDGSGYPRNIKRGRIPLESRIIAIIDAYDTMVNGKCYKKKMTKKEAIRELKNYSRTQFDPKLVEEFIDIIGKKR